MIDSLERRANQLRHWLAELELERHEDAYLDWLETTIEQPRLKVAKLSDLLNADKQYAEFVMRYGKTYRA